MIFQYDIFRLVQMNQNRKISPAEAFVRVQQENVDELDHTHDIRNLLDFNKLDNYQNHVPPIEYTRSSGEIGQLLIQMLKIVPVKFVEELDIYLETNTDQVYNENH